MKVRVLAAAVAAASMALASGAQATVILFSNFDSVINPLPNGGGFRILPSADGWTSTTRGIEIQFNNVAGRSFSGSSHVELDTNGNSSMFLDLTRGHYEISYHYSPRPNVGAASNGISLLDGTRLLDSVTGAGASQTVWQQRSVQFFTLGGPLTFQATGNSDALGGYLDDISLSTVTVPEPASWAMLIAGFGLVGMAARRRRRIAAHQMPRVLA